MKLTENEWSNACNKFRENGFICGTSLKVKIANDAALMAELRQIAHDEPQKTKKKKMRNFLDRIKHDYKMDDYQRTKEMIK